MAMEASGDIESLQKSIYQKDGQEIRLMDKLPGEKREEERILDHLLLNDLLNTLDPRSGRSFICGILQIIRRARSEKCSVFPKCRCREWKSRS